MKNDWKRRNSLRSGEIGCACVGVTGVYEVYEVWREREEERMQQGAMRKSSA